MVASTSNNTPAKNNDGKARIAPILSNNKGEIPNLGVRYISKESKANQP